MRSWFLLATVLALLAPAAQAADCALPAKVARAARARGLDGKDFRAFWKDTCSGPIALRAAKAAKAGEIDVNAFHDYYGTSCAKKRGEEALELATLVRAGAVDRTDFLRQLKGNCDFSRALKAARAQRAPSFLEPPRVEDPSEIPAQ